MNLVGLAVDKEPGIKQLLKCIVIENVNDDHYYIWIFNSYANSRRTWADREKRSAPWQDYLPFLLKLSNNLILKHHPSPVFATSVPPIPIKFIVYSCQVDSSGLVNSAFYVSGKAEC